MNSINHAALSRRSVLGAIAAGVLPGPTFAQAASNGIQVMNHDEPFGQSIRYISYPSVWRESPITVCGRLQTPDHASSPRPAVIILHGSAGVSPRGIYYGDALNRAGMATFEIDMWGARGLAGGPGGRPKTVAETLPDIYGAIDLLASLPHINAQRIALLGFSWGGVATMLATTRHYTSHLLKPGRPLIAAAVAVYPVCWIYNKVPGYVFGELLPIPLRVLVGGRDDYDDGDAACRNLLATLTPQERERVKLIAYPSAGHAFDGFAPAYTHTDAMAHLGRGGEVRVEIDAAARAGARHDIVSFFQSALN